MAVQEIPFKSRPPLIAVTARLPVGCYRFLFEQDPQCELVGYSGSAWRGAFGHALKRLVCITRERHCPNCLLYYGCIYPYIFETPPPPNTAKMRRYNVAPHPFLLEPPDADDAHEELNLYTFGFNAVWPGQSLPVLSGAGPAPCGRIRFRCTSRTPASC